MFTKSPLLTPPMSIPLTSPTGQYFLVSAHHQILPLNQHHEPRTKKPSNSFPPPPSKTSCASVFIQPYRLLHTLLRAADEGICISSLPQKRSLLITYPFRYYSFRGVEKGGGGLRWEGKGREGGRGVEGGIRAGGGKGRGRGCAFG